MSYEEQIMSKDKYLIIFSPQMEAIIFIIFSQRAQFSKLGNIYYLLTESEVITGKSQTEALMYRPSDSEVNTVRRRSEISL